MYNYIFLTHEGYTFQPNSESEIPDIENLQVIGFSVGNSADEAFANLLHENSYLQETTFDEVYCYKLDREYEQTRRDYNLKT